MKRPPPFVLSQWAAADNGSRAVSALRDFSVQMAVDVRGFLHGSGSRWERDGRPRARRTGADLEFSIQRSCQTVEQRQPRAPALDVPAHPAAIILHRQDEGGVASGKGHANAPGAPIGERVLQCIGDELVDDEPHWNGNAEGKIVAVGVARKRDRRWRARLEVVAHVTHERATVHSVAIVRHV